MPALLLLSFAFQVVLPEDKPASEMLIEKPKLLPWCPTAHSRFPLDFKRTVRNLLVWHHSSITLHAQEASEEVRKPAPALVSACLGCPECFHASCTKCQAARCILTPSDPKPFGPKPDALLHILLSFLQRAESAMDHDRVASLQEHLKALPLELLICILAHTAPEVLDILP